MEVYYGSGRNQAELDARARGYKGGFGAGGYVGYDKGTHDAYGNPIGGVMPVGQVEPLHDYSKTALQTFGTNEGNPYTSGYMDAFTRAMGGAGDPSKYYNMATDMVTSGAGPVSDADFSRAIARYMNPYTQQVIDASTQSMRDEAARRQAGIMDRRAGSRSFGDTSMGQQLGEIDRGIVRDVGELEANLRSASYGGAVNQFNQDRANALTGGQVFSGMGSRMFSNLGDVMRFAGAGNDMRRSGIIDQLNAGMTIQGQNQKVLDVLRPEIYGQTNYQTTNLQNLADMLNAFPGSQVGATPGTPNTLQTLGGLGMVAGSMWPSSTTTNAPTTYGPWYQG